MVTLVRKLIQISTYVVPSKTDQNFCRYVKLVFGTPYIMVVLWQLEKCALLIQTSRIGSGIANLASI